MTVVRWALAAVLLWAAAVEAQTDQFAEGNRLYQQGDFDGAAATYGAVLEAGYESAELYYNLGNAHFRLDNLTDAVLNYERAARLDPGNDNVAANLALVRQRLQDRIEPIPRFWLLTAFDWWMAAIPGRILVAVAAGSYYLLGFALLLLVLDRPRGWRPVVRRMAYVGIGASVLFGATLGARVLGLGQPEEAIVRAPEVQVLSEPSTSAGLTVFTIHEGTKVRIDQRAGEWAEVVLADGKVGWVRVDAFEVI